MLCSAPIGVASGLLVCSAMRGVCSAVVGGKAWPLVICGGLQGLGFVKDKDSHFPQPESFDTELSGELWLVRGKCFPSGLLHREKRDYFHKLEDCPREETDEMMKANVKEST